MKDWGGSEVRTIVPAGGTPEGVREKVAGFSKALIWREVAGGMPSKW